MKSGCCNNAGRWRGKTHLCKIFTGQQKKKSVKSIRRSVFSFCQISCNSPNCSNLISIQKYSCKGTWFLVYLFGVSFWILLHRKGKLEICGDKQWKPLVTISPHWYVFPRKRKMVTNFKKSAKFSCSSYSFLIFLLWFRS